MKAGLKIFFEQYGKLTEAVMKNLTSKFEQNEVKKNKTLLFQGHVNDKIYFVNKGCLRLYYIVNSIEITVWFSFENNTAIEFSSFLSGAPSDYFIEAIEDSEILSIHKSELTNLCKQHPEMERVIRIFWEDVILNLLKRFTALQKDTAEKRYLDLMSQPTYFQRVPQKYLASYIGVTPTSLSRIRRNVK
jgi:CRP-like cAMP-binding protein